MKPYYQDDFITLYHADCLQHLDVLDQADVMVTDPPYGMKYYSGRRKEDDRIHGDDNLNVRDQVLAAWGKTIQCAPHLYLEPGNRIDHRGCAS